MVFYKYLCATKMSPISVWAHRSVLHSGTVKHPCMGTVIMIDNMKYAEKLCRYSFFISRSEFHHGPIPCRVVPWLWDNGTAKPLMP